MTPTDTDTGPAVMTLVPNQPKTPLHSFRVSDDLWEKAKATATANGTTVAEVLRAALERYVKRGAK